MNDKETKKGKPNLKKVPINSEIPQGWRILELEEAKQLKNEINEVCQYRTNTWFIVAFSQGKLDGTGYGNVFSETYGSECGEKIIGEVEVDLDAGPAALAPLKLY